MIKEDRNLTEITLIDSGVVTEIKGQIVEWNKNGAAISVNKQLHSSQKLALRIFDVDSKTSSMLGSFHSEELQRNDVEVQGVVESTKKDETNEKLWSIQVKFFGKVRFLRPMRR